MIGCQVSALLRIRHECQPLHVRTSVVVAVGGGKTRDCESNAACDRLTDAR